LCLGAFVAICSPPVADPGYGFINFFDKSRKDLTCVISIQKS
jgi:hypothetical protein